MRSSTVDARRSAKRLDHIDEKDFNDIVEALLVREYTREGLEAHALSGRGGDDGIDVEVRSK